MRRIIVGLVASVAVIGVLVGASATAVTDEQLEIVAARCVRVQMSIRNLQRSDALIRVGLGRNYEFVLTRLMTPMNSRLVAHHMDAGNLLEITARFNENLGYFRRNYITYDRLIGELLAMDCARRPRDFYERLEAARHMRGEVRFNYVMLNEIIEEYMREIEVIEERMRRG